MQPYRVVGALLLLLIAVPAFADEPPKLEDPRPADPGKVDPAVVRGQDVVVQNNGKVWEGRIVSEDREWVEIEQGSDQGGLMRIKLRREDIKSIRRGEGGPAPRGGSRPIRDEWFLLRSDGRIVGTRRLELWSVRTKGKPGYRLEEHREFFAQGPRLPATRTHYIEVCDLKFQPLLLSFREIGDASSDVDGPRRFERNVSGRVRGGMWHAAVSASGTSRTRQVPVATGTRGRLGLREHLLRLPREVRLRDCKIIDADVEGLVDVRAGFASVESGKRGHEFHWEEGERRLISWFHQDQQSIQEEIAEGVDAVPVSREQAEAALGGGEGDVPEDPTERVIKLPEAGIGFTLPDRLWKWKPYLARPDNTGWRVLGLLSTRVTLADIRIEWHPKAPGSESDPERVKDWLVQRLRGAAPDLKTLGARTAVPGLASPGSTGGWRMDFVGTLKGESVRTIAVVVDRPLGRVVLLLACPTTAWEQGRPALDRFVGSLQLL